LADIFISYSRLDLDRVRPIAERLTLLGYSVWWDRDLRAGAMFADEIERQLDGARAVLTAWSHNARNSTWVYAESSRGLDAHKFLQVRLDGAHLPLPFDALQCAEVRGERAEWGPLEAALERLVRKGHAPELSHAPQIGALATPAPVGSIKLLTFATGAALAAYAGAVSAAYNGLMTPDQLQIALIGMIGVAGASVLLTAHRLLSVAQAGG
jgi:hypothetical protein